MKMKTYFDTILAIGAIILLILVIRLQVRIIAGQQNGVAESRPARIDNSQQNDQNSTPSDDGSSWPETLANQIARAIERNSAQETVIAEQVQISPTQISPTAAGIVESVVDVSPGDSVISSTVSTANQEATVGVEAENDSEAGYEVSSEQPKSVDSVIEEAVVEEEVSREVIVVSATDLMTDTRLAVSADSTVSNAVGGVAITVSKPPTAAEGLPLPTEDSQQIPQSAPSSSDETPVPPLPSPESPGTNHFPTRPISEATISIPENYNVNARYTTDTESTVLRILPAGTAWMAIGRTIDTAWLQIVLSDGTLAWVFTESVENDPTVENLPIVLAPPLE